MTTVPSIRDEFFGKGKTISEIAREQEIDRKTVRKFTEREDWNRREQAARDHRSILDPFKPVIDAWLEEDRKRRRKQRHTAKRVYDRLCEEYAEDDFAGSYRTVTGCVCERREEIYQEVRAGAAA